MTYYINLIKNEFLVFVFMALILFLTYAPITDAYYIYHDAIYSHDLAAKGDFACSDHIQYKPNMIEGRPLGILLRCKLESTLKDISSGNFVRSVTVLLICFLAFLIYLWFRRNNETILHACLLSLLIFTMPPFLTLASICTGHPYITGMIATALIAIPFMSSSLFRKICFKRYFQQGIVIILLLFIPLTIAQPTAMFWFFIIFVPLSRMNGISWRKYRRGMLYFILIALLGAVVYLIIFKTIYSSMVAGLTGDLITRGQLEVEYFRKIQYFFEIILTFALNLNNLYVNKQFAAIVLLCIIVGPVIELIRAMVQSNQSGASKLGIIMSLLQKYSLIFVLLVFSVGPILAAKGYNASFRGLLAMSPMVVVLLYRSIQQICKMFKQRGPVILTTLLMAATVINIFSANNNLRRYNAIPRSLEYMYARGALQAHLDKLLSDDIIGIHVVRPYTPKDFITDIWHADEFGAPVTFFEQDIDYFINTILRDLGVEKKFEITWAIVDVEVPDNRFELDLQMMRSLATKPTKRRKGLMLIREVIFAEHGPVEPDQIVIY